MSSEIDQLLNRQRRQTTAGGEDDQENLKSKKQSRIGQLPDLSAYDYDSERVVQQQP